MCHVWREDLINADCDHHQHIDFLTASSQANQFRLVRSLSILVIKSCATHFQWLSMRAPVLYECDRWCGTQEQCSHMIRPASLRTCGVGSHWIGGSSTLAVVHRRGCWWGRKVSDLPTRLT